MGNSRGLSGEPLARFVLLVCFSHPMELLNVVSADLDCIAPQTGKLHVPHACQGPTKSVVEDLHVQHVHMDFMPPTLLRA